MTETDETDERYGPPNDREADYDPLRERDVEDAPEWAVELLDRTRETIEAARDAAEAARNDPSRQTRSAPETNEAHAELMDLRDTVEAVDPPDEPWAREFIERQTDLIDAVAALNRALSEDYRDGSAGKELLR